MLSLKLTIKIIILPITSMQGKPYSTSTSSFQAKGWTIGSIGPLHNIGITYAKLVNDVHYVFLLINVYCSNVGQVFVLFGNNHVLIFVDERFKE
jgi:hypothetical protein